MRNSLLGSLLVAWLFSVSALTADAQSGIELNTSVTGEIGTNTTQTYSFTALDGQVLSFLASSTSNLDPELTLANSSGTVLLKSDDYAYPESLDALMEAITIPRTDTYTLTVSGVNGSTGTYQLTMFSGYSTFDLQEDFQRGTWEPDTASLQIGNVDNSLQLQMNQPGQTSAALSATEDVRDGYIQVRVASITGDSTWRTGLIFRQQSSGQSYLYEVNQAGAWRFSLRTENELTVIRDWVNHPAIRSGETAFTLGVLMNDVGFSFFYNGQFIGSEVDETLSNAGRFGVAVGTPGSATADLTVTFDDFVLTTPRLIDGAGIQPQQLITESSGSETVLALTHQRLISGRPGEMALTVPESTAEFARPGVNTILLGRGTVYENFAMGTTVSLQASLPGPAGCGLVFRYSSSDSYTLAYLDATGAYGVSRRAGSDFLPGIFAQSSVFTGDRHQLLIIANQAQVTYYIDGFYLGSLEDPARAGEVGGAAVNFEGITTMCRFEDTWLWRWD